MAITIGVNPYAKREFLTKKWEKALKEVESILSPNMTLDGGHKGYTWIGIYVENISSKANFFGFKNKSKKWQEIILMTVSPYGGIPDIDSIRISSLIKEYDNLAKEIAIKFARYYPTQYNPYEYSDVECGSIKCKYCGQFSSNAEKCINCGGVPI
jgi:hypothetical protein